MGQDDILPRRPSRAVRRLRKLRRALSRPFEERKQRAWQATLEAQAPEQREVFARLAPKFLSRYQALSSHAFDQYVTDTWRGFNARIEQALLPQPSFGFLEDTTLRMAMFVTDAGTRMQQQRQFLEQRLGDEAAAAWVREDPTGAPTIHAPDLMASHNSLHHAYHLERYAADAGDPWSTERIVEWGGGYGGLARLYLRRHQGRPTYTIVDTPLFSCLQWIYLSSVLGPDRVHLLTTPEDSIRSEKVNLLPLGLLDRHADALRAGLFISTWALSESGPHAVEAVQSQDWFGASRLLLAFQDPSPDHPCAGLVAEHAMRAGAVPQAVPLIPGNQYAFR